MNRIPILLAFFFLLANYAADSKTVFVDAVNGDDTIADGTPNRPWKHISAALNQNKPALKEGDVIRCEPGTYSKGEVFPLDLSAGISIIGEASNAVVLDAQSTDASILFVTGTSTPIRVAGLTLQHSQFAGVYAVNSDNLTIESCIIRKNHRGIIGSGEAVIRDNRITENTAFQTDVGSVQQYNNYEVRGAGIFYIGEATIANNLISQNTAAGNYNNYMNTAGGGVYCSGTIYMGDNAIFENSAYTNYFHMNAAGGGIYCNSTQSTLTLSRNLIQGNSALGMDAGLGGGIHCSGELRMDSNRVYDNSAFGHYASSSGGGVNCWGKAYLTNNVFANNSAQNAGALDLSNCQHILFCTFFNNQSEREAISLGAGATVANSIISNSDAIGLLVYGANAKLKVIHNNFWQNKGGHLLFEEPEQMLDVMRMNQLSECSGNFERNPMFVNPMKNNFHLEPFSPCKGHAVASLAGIEMPLTDLEDNSRMVPGDIGAFQSIDTQSFIEK